MKLETRNSECRNPDQIRGESQGIAREYPGSISSCPLLHPCPLLPIPSHLVPPMLWHSCTCCENMEQKRSGEGEEAFPAGGDVEKS